MKITQVLQQWREELADEIESIPIFEPIEEGTVHEKFVSILPQVEEAIASKTTLRAILVGLQAAGFGTLTVAYFRNLLSRARKEYEI